MGMDAVAGADAKKPQISRRFDTLGADGAPVRLGFFGGTFDPIHIGHLAIGEEMRQALELDAVIYIPAGNPVFKKDQRVTDAAHRVEMCRRAVLPNPWFDVSTIEAEREGYTFTVDTLKQLRAHYPENVTFYFIVGSDTAATVGKWRGIDEIAQLTHLAVAAGRPGSAQEPELRRAIEEAAAFDYHIVRAASLEVSSSALRQRLAQGDACRYYLTDAVRSYISEHGLYRAGEALQADAQQADALQGETTQVVARQPGTQQSEIQQDVDPLSKAFFKARRAELETRVSPKRFTHSLGVSDACVQLAETYGIDVKKARLAGILHDWDKGMDDDQARARVVELGMEDEIDPWVVENMPRVLHGYTAARALGRDFPQIPHDILQAIDRHTTAAENMEPLDMVLYIADAIEPGRTFGRIDELRAQVGRVSLEELYYQTYEYWTFLLFERRQPLHPDTMRIWNANALRWQKTRPKSSKKKRR